MGGDFDMFNGVPVPKLIRLLANGTLIGLFEQELDRMHRYEMYYNWIVDSCWRLATSRNTTEKTSITLLA